MSVCMCGSSFVNHQQRYDKLNKEDNIYNRNIAAIHSAFLVNTILLWVFNLNPKQFYQSPNIILKLAILWRSPYKKFVLSLKGRMGVSCHQLKKSPYSIQQTNWSNCKYSEGWWRNICIKMPLKWDTTVGGGLILPFFSTLGI